ncbi:MAG: MBL fold metallo-hydrolase [Halanaerobiaceae bacterium]
MKLTILGSRAAYSNKNEGCSGYLIQEGDFNLLLDCGSGTISALQNYIELTELDNVILSHYHPDHYSDISILQHGIMIESMVNNEKNHIYIYGHQDDELFNKLTYKDYTTGKSYQEDKPLQLGPLTITFLKTHHSAIGYAMKISNGKKEIVYTSDTAYFDDLVSFSENVDLLLAESSLYPETDGQQMGHMNSTDSANLARNANSKKLILTHLPNYGDNQELLKNAMKIFPGNVKLAYSGYKEEL